MALTPTRWPTLGVATPSPTSATMPAAPWPRRAVILRELATEGSANSLYTLAVDSFGFAQDRLFSRKLPQDDGALFSVHDKTYVHTRLAPNRHATRSQPRGGDA